ncbi:ABC transporter permease [Marinoscillum sp.]|uniref:ABC transporter permease n=1 Tax=Marinoscillum sp. TaxID=2024838 RepID=UPI003BA9B5F9
MLRNYILSSIRSLRKKLGFTLVNIIGLALGMATCLIIYLYVDRDLSYDDFQSDQVYRIALDRIYPERHVEYAFVPHSIGPQMVLDFPEVSNQTRLFKAFAANTIQYEDKSYLEEGLVFADSSIFDLLTIELLIGDIKTALRDPNAVVINETIAKKIFGNPENAIGKFLTIGNATNPVEVTAVANDYPETSHFEFDFLVPMHSLDFFNQPNWLSFSALTYIQIDGEVDPNDIEDRIQQMLKQYAEGQMQARNGISYDEYLASGNGYDYFLQPIKDIHLHSHLEGEIKANGNITYIYIFSIVAAFILIIACINFMNLSTARSTERGKEVGIRKVLGSAKGQLIGQFLTESVIITLIGATLAGILAFFSLPYFNDMTGTSLSIKQLLNPVAITGLVLIILMIGFLAGAYPAFFISSYQPVAVLKGKLKSSSKGIGLRNVLVVLQFTISIALISSTMIVDNQMSFLLNKPLGFEEDNVIVIENAFGLNNANDEVNWNRYETFKSELVKLPNVQSAAVTTAMPGDILPGYVVKVPGDTEKESMVTRNLSFDDEMVETLGLKLVEGRFFSKEFNDSLSTILNESAVNKLGISDPIGKKLININNSNEQVEYTIIGVVEDFHFQSLHVQMEPIAITSIESQNAFPAKIAVKIAADRTKNTLSSIETQWNEFAPQAPFQSYFLDNDLESFYQSEKTTGQIFGIFTFLAIVIACVGLLGLSAFIINQRVKEIGVRKVLGASVPSIVLLLSKDFTKLILISAVIAIPPAYYYMNQWIGGFAYASSISWYTFLVAGLIALFIGLFTISFQSIKAAMTNPVNSLKDE